jgi:hypothetical protein
VVEDGLASLADVVVAAGVDVGGCVVADAGVAVLVVVVLEEVVCEGSCMVEAGESVGESWRVLDGLEL